MAEKSDYFYTIYEAHQAMVFRLCKGYFNGDATLAADAAQEVFIKVWQHLDGFRKDSSLSTWIYRITVNVCLTYLKKASRKREVPHEQIPDGSADAYDITIEERFQQMYRCIGQLDETSRIIILMVLEGVSYTNIASVTGFTESNVRVRIHRIKQQLSNCVQ